MPVSRGYTEGFQIGTRQGRFSCIVELTIPRNRSVNSDLIKCVKLNVNHLKGTRMHAMLLMSKVEVVYV